MSVNNVSKKFWMLFKPSVIAKQAGAVTFLDYSPDASLILMTALSSISIFEIAKIKLKSQIRNFSGRAYSGFYRNDGKLIMAGGDNPIVQVFDSNYHNVLRQLIGQNRFIVLSFL